MAKPTTAKKMTEQGIEPPYQSVNKKIYG